jgi:L-malate glycosyltransferase
MRILLLSDTYSEHTEKWALSLANNGIQVGLFSFNKAAYSWYIDKPNIELLFEPEKPITGFGLKEKLNYFKYLPILKSKIKTFKPDILHAHYATSYGLIAALSRFKPFVVSVWGADVYDFPKQNSINKRILKYVLRKANMICSTSHCMKTETQLYTSNPITVIPFGIDIEKFNRTDQQLPLKNHQLITIGNIKPLESKYGIDTLIHAFNNITKKFPKHDFQLLLVGEGSERDKYESLCIHLDIKDKVVFTGRVPHIKIADYHKKIDLFISLSVLDSESFGVSLVEAMASKSCIIASNVAGFNEVLGGDNSCGFLIPKNNTEAAVQAISDYINDPFMAIKKAKNARERAINLYNWQQNVQLQIDVYHQQLIKF